MWFILFVMIIHLFIFAEKLWFCEFLLFFFVSTFILIILFYFVLSALYCNFLWFADYLVYSKDNEKLDVSFSVLDFCEFCLLYLDRWRCIWGWHKWNLFHIGDCSDIKKCLLEVWFHLELFLFNYWDTLASLELLLGFKIKLGFY